MPNRFASKFALRAAPIAAALILAAAAPAPAAAQEGPTALQKLFGKLGLLEIPDENPPEYRERAPLVVPPTTALIPPREPGEISTYNPDWPRDHDTRRRNAVDPEVARKADEDFYSGRALMPSELSRGRISREEAARRDATKPAPETVGSSQRALSPSQLGFTGWGNKKEETVVFTGEPARTSLTQPPPGLYTPSKDAPYGVVSSKPAPVKASTLYDRVSGSDDPANRK